MNKELETFFDELDRQIQETEHIINEIEKVVFTKRYNLSKKHVAIFSVQTIAMLYSIWEGFIQKTFSSYLVALNNLGLSFNDFKDSLKVFHMESTFKQFKQYPTKLTGRARFITDLYDFFRTDDCQLYTSVNTESNVGFQVLNRIMEQFSLDTFPEIWGDYKYPNLNLKDRMTSFLNYRNSIAHGGDLSSDEKVTQEVFNQYKLLVINLMHGVREKIYEGAINQHYQK